MDENNSTNENNIQNEVDVVVPQIPDVPQRPRLFFDDATSLYEELSTDSKVDKETPFSSDESDSDFWEETSTSSAIKSDNASKSANENSEKKSKVQFSNINPEFLSPTRPSSTSSDSSRVLAFFPPPNSPPPPPNECPPSQQNQSATLTPDEIMASLPPPEIQPPPPEPKLSPDEIMASIPPPATAPPPPEPKLSPDEIMASLPPPETQPPPPSEHKPTADEIMASLPPPEVQPPPPGTVTPESIMAALPPPEVPPPPPTNRAESPNQPLLEIWEGVLERYKTNPHKKQKIGHFVRRGIPGEVRSDVWLILSHGTIRKRHSNKTINDYLLMPSLDCYIDIRKDCNEITLPILNYQEMSDDFKHSLCNVMYSVMQYFKHEMCYYCELLYVASIFVKYMDEENAFYSMIGILNNPKILYKHFFMCGSRRIIILNNVLKELLRKDYNELMDYLDGKDIDLCDVTKKWFLTAFQSVHLSRTFLIRILEGFMLNGLRFLVSVAYIVLKIHRKKILKIDERNEILKLLENIGESNKMENWKKIIKAAHRDIPKKIFNELMIKYTNENEEE
ncbi:TBC domain containing protein [Histomonas meleagridis]|uniref:TBC domain containing protein n=1 Tax=Histomonas meleagridis TaxID=135588 RepID=UPI00355AC45A|nr:TBC domain containing protein [Histomonas meleagridis]KAH0800196.1 TBC domain containing protein [Histomonas meleagridis]